MTPVARPKISPLTIDDCEERTRAFIEHPDIASSRARNVYLTFARHPGLLAKWAPFAGKLMRGKLSRRDRELLTLRAAWLWRAEYEWGQHVLLGAEAGLSDEDILHVTRGPASDHWSPADAALLGAADDLRSSGRISDAVWDELAQRLDEHQMMEVPLVVGQYAMLSFLLNSIDIEREEGVPGFDQFDAPAAES
jgi:alkylhydroperoxidase family enzyme